MLAMLLQPKLIRQITLQNNGVLQILFLLGKKPTLTPETDIC